MALLSVQFNKSAWQIFFLMIFYVVANRASEIDKRSERYLLACSHAEAPSRCAWWTSLTFPAEIIDRKVTKMKMISPSNRCQLTILTPYACFVDPAHQHLYPAVAESYFRTASP